MTCNLAHAVGWIVGLPLLARDVFGGGPETYGYLMAAYGVGNVASNLLVGSLTVRRRERMLFGGGIVYGLGFLLVAVAPSFEIALVASALAAVGGPMTDLMILLLVQTRIPTAHVGKVLSLRYTISQASLGAALLLAAPIYVWLPVRAAIAVVGLIVVGCAVVASLRLTSPPADPARRSARAPW
jgi:predicted MFS family arabinose efflux permease